MRELVTVILRELGALVPFLRRRYHAKEGFEFVYMNQDGSVREVSPGEKAYLTTEFVPGDGNRPYIKFTHLSRDSVGSLSGYIRRCDVPANIRILPVHPDYDRRNEAMGFHSDDSLKASGYISKTLADGSILWSPNPNIPNNARWDLIREHELAEERKREQLAAMPDEDSPEDDSDKRAS